MHTLSLLHRPRQEQLRGVHGPLTPKHGTAAGASAVGEGKSKRAQTCPVYGRGEVQIVGRGADCPVEMAAVSGLVLGYIIRLLY
jgi:hypothetical protein